MKTILLTGSTGFIGRNIKESFFNQKYNLLCPTHAELDLLDRGKTVTYFKDHNIDVVLHTAMSPVASETVIMYYNLQLACSLNWGPRIINFNSGAIYDRYKDLYAIREDQIGYNIPTDDYGMSKYICYKLRTVDTIDLILFGVFGKYEKPFRFIPKITTALLQGRQPIVNYRSMNFVWVEDVIRLLDILVNNSWGVSALNICPDNFFYLPNMAKQITSILNIPNSSFILGSAVENTYIGSGALLRKLYYFEFTSMDKAIETYVTYLKEDFYAKRAT